MNTVTVIGSINLDRTIRVKNMPKPGETIHTKEIFSAGGGKGANQAVAAQRSGAKTHFIGAVGDDDAGKTMLDLLTQEKINLAGITKMTKQSTGQAYVTVDDAGENQIMIHGGANMAFTPDDVAAHRDIIEASDFVVAQFESAVDSTVEAFKIAQAAGVKTILNPAPAMEKVPAELLAVTDMIVPNETETETLTGIAITDEASMMKASAALHELGISAVIITIGSKGAFYDINGRHGVIPAFKVEAVDTTSAGDTFIGAMSSVLDKDFSNLEDAIRYGNRASSIAVQRFGAQPSIPYKNEITAAEGK
ncbi:MULTISPECIES: ribokinase [Lactiplantibacillus]|jgi:ribokinase|uniref:Ribokinase n=5 Tax=Lactiplantibacillus pentosus TaxID=1589 RepID=A0A241RPM4_LACPE|nr:MULTISPECIES: ribokinase [Lactiplantibacillus]CCC17098.1 ribokinase [Lactiplantibacillus pentosus IG1]ASG79847.1 ribokinase [Lactiplantibacillus pentosus]AUI80108.1 ribokinase [Lactiplantibacillus pentosus]AYG38821.1 ribokinase [Lactiplantibacillus pentosus]AYG41481.1 ribokinase [Lactiplantibacillus pentosus]